MTTSLWTKKLLNPTDAETCDIVIVGGGYVGLSTAYWLSEIDSSLKITVIERSFCGAGASGKNAGFLTMGSTSFYKSLTNKWGEKDALGIYEFARNSLQLVHDHILSKTKALNFKKTSSMTLLKSQEQLDDYNKSSFVSKNFGYSWKENHELPSPLRSSFYGAFETGPEYSVNPLELLASIINILKTRGIKIIESNSAFELTQSGVVTDVNTIKAKKVILALNAYLPQFNPAFKKIITPTRAQMLAVELERELDCNSLYYDTPEKVYWRKVSDKVLIIGGKRTLDEKGETGDFEKLSPLIQQGLEDYLTTQLKLKYKVINRWSGIMGFTEHELPISTKIDAPIEAYAIGGFTGHGMGLGFNAAKDIAEVVTGRKQNSFFTKFLK